MCVCVYIYIYIYIYICVLLTGNCNSEDRVTDVKHEIVEMLGREGQDANVALCRLAD